VTFLLAKARKCLITSPCNSYNNTTFNACLNVNTLRFCGNKYLLPLSVNSVSHTASAKTFNYPLRENIFMKKNHYCRIYRTWTSVSQPASYFLFHLKLTHILCTTVYAIKHACLIHIMPTFIERAVRSNFHGRSYARVISTCWLSDKIFMFHAERCSRTVSLTFFVPFKLHHNVSLLHATPNATWVVWPVHPRHKISSYAYRTVYVDSP
jgi:hypothetical protein